MTIYEMFIETLKLIFKGKGKYNCRLLIDGYEEDINGFLCTDTEPWKRAIFW